MAWLANHATIDVHPWTSTDRRVPQPDLCADRHRPGREDDVGRRAHPHAAVPDRAGASQGQRRCPRSPASAASRSGSRSSRSTPTARRAPGSKRFHGPSARPCRSSCRGIGPRRRAAAWPGSTSPRTPSTRRSSRHMPCVPCRTRQFPRPSRGTSSTIQTCAQDAGTSSPSCRASPQRGDLFAPRSDQSAGPSSDRVMRTDEAF